MDTDKTILNKDTITSEGDLIFARIYAAMYPGVPFIEDIRPDYTIKIDDFNTVLTSVFGDSPRTILYQSFVSGRAFEILYINSFKVMLFLQKLIPEDIVDRKHKLSSKDVEVLTSDGATDEIGRLADSLENRDSDEEEDESLAPTIYENELTDVILRVFYYPIENKSIGEDYCRAHDLYKFDREAKLEKGVDDVIFTLGSTQSGLTLFKHYLDTSKYKEGIIEANYNDNFKPSYDKIITFLKSDDSGLILLTGEPGTGKSSFLLHLTSVCADINTKFVFLPSAFAGVLSDPAFLPFAVTKLNNTVLILEDAEEILSDRSLNTGSAVSNILNISDGILGKVTTIKIIATVNKPSVIDLAILRKGRLKLQYKFEKLVPDKANLLLERLGHAKRVTEPTTLTELYNTEENVVPTVLQDTRKIGFKS